MPISNAMKEQMLKDEIRKRGEFLMERFREMAHDGPPIPGRPAPPPEKLLQYFKDTLPDEMGMAMNEDYPELVDAGVAPEPAPHVWYVLAGGKEVPWFDDGTGVPKVRPFLTPEEAAYAAQQLGLPPNPDGTPPIEPHLNFWSLIISLPTNWEWTPWKYHSREFKRLFEEYGRRIEERL